MELKPADIRDHWPRIRDLVARALRGDDVPPEEVYAACRFGNASLYVSDDAAFVLRQSDRDEVRIWVAVGWGGRTAQRYSEELARICREAGAARMSFVTNRKGFERVAPAGWRPEWTTYVWRLK